MAVDPQTQKIFKQVLTEKTEVTDDQIEKELDSISSMHEAESLLTHAKDARRKYDREWLSRDLFRRGYQFASQDPTTGSITITSATKARIPINLTWAFMRAIKNQVTSFNPKWEVLPDFKGAKSEQNARLTGKLLDYLYKKMNVNKLIKESVIQGLQFSVGGPFEVYWDPNYDNGSNSPRGEVVITLHDPFDIYVDPKATSLADAEYVIKCVRTPVSEIKNNPDYDSVKEQLVGGTSKLAESEYKQFLLQTIYNTQSATSENETVILKEIQKKERAEDGSIKIKILTWCDGVTRPLKNVTVDKEDFDMESFQADMNPLEFYGSSWMKHVMPLNKALNALESSVFEYSYRFAKGRLLIDKNAGVDIVTNEHGSIIEKERGSEVSTLPIAPLPSDITNQIIRLRAMMEDIAGIHESCVSDDTYILTTRGWKLRKQLQDKEEILTFNTDTQELELDFVQDIHVYEKDELTQIKNKNIDALATDNHRWPVVSVTSGKIKFKETKDLSTNDRIILSSGGYKQNHKRYSDEFVELVGWAVTDGYFEPDKTKVRIIQSCKHKYECSEIERILKANSIKASKYEDKDQVCQWAFYGDAAKELIDLCPNRQLTYDFLNSLTYSQSQKLYKQMMLADGCEEGSTDLFYSTTKANIEKFEYLCALLGYNTASYTEFRDTYDIRVNGRHSKGKSKDSHRVSVKKQTLTTGFTNLKRKEKTLSKVSYEGKVWCPSTNNQTWVAKRNGKVFITGNSLGRVPGSVKSGIGIAELKQSDSSNQDDLVQNLEHCLMRLGRKILRLISENYTTPRVAKVVGTGRMIEHFAVVGRNYVSDEKTTWKIGEEEYPLAKIGVGNELEVKIGSWLAYTKEARQKTILDLAKAGILSKEDVLRYFEFPNVQDAIDRVRAEQIVELKRKESQEMPSGISQEQLALAENEMLSEGLPAPVDPIEDDHELHIAVHMSEVGQGRANQLVASHIKEHRRSQKGGGSPMNIEQMAQPQRIPMPPPQGIMAAQGQGVPLAEQKIPIPPVTRLSAGVAEVPPTAGKIIGGPTNAIPTR